MVNLLLPSMALQNDNPTGSWNKHLYKMTTRGCFPATHPTCTKPQQHHPHTKAARTPVPTQQKLTQGLLWGKDVHHVT